MRSNLIFRSALLSVTLSINLLLATCSAQIFYVRQSGDDDNSGTSASQAFRTIERALNASNGTMRIHVGAGVYSVNVSRSIPGAQISIMGDVNGARTGDAGKVVFRSDNGRYALSIRNASLLYVGNVIFESAVAGGRGRGIEARTMSSYVYTKECSFRDLWYGIVVAQSDFYYGAVNRYENCKYAVDVSDCETSYVYQDSFVNCYRPISNKRSEKAYIIGCQITQPEQGAAGWAVTNAVIKSLLISDCGLSGSKFGAIASTDIGSLRIRNVTAKGFSDGLQVKAESSNLQEIALYGGTTRSGSALRFIGESTPTLNECSVENFYYGINLDGPKKVQASKIKLNSNVYAFRVGSQSAGSSFDFTDFAFDENQTAVFIDYRSEDDRISIRNLASATNRTGIRADRGQLKVQDCKFKDCYRAITHASGKDTTISNVDVSLIEDSGSTGLHLQTFNATIDKVRVLGGRTGIMMALRDDTGRGSVQNVHLGNQLQYALHVDKGRLRLDESDNILITDANYGILSRYSDLTIDGVNPQANRCFDAHYGSLTLRNAHCSSGHRMLEARRLDKLIVESCSSKEFIHYGLYLYMNKDVEIKDFDSDSTRDIMCYYTDQFVASGLKLHGSSYGLYLYNRTAPLKFSLSESVIDGPTYGFRAIGVPITPKNFHHLSFLNCNHAVRSEHSDALINEESQITFKNNRIACLSLRGHVRLSDINIDETQTYGLYASHSSADVENCKISAKSYGLLLYGKDCGVSNSRFTTSSYPIYYAPFEDATPKVVDCRIQPRTTGIYTAGRRNVSAKVYVGNTEIVAGRYGLYSRNMEVETDNLTVRNPSLTAVDGRDCKSLHTGLTVDGSRYWAGYWNQGSVKLVRAKMSSKRGIFLGPQQGELVNCAVSGGYYGAYCYRGENRILQTTFGNAQYMGIYHYGGSLELRNSIIDSRQYGLYQRNKSLAAKHDYNLVNGDRVAYVNATPSLHEIEKQPIFVNAGQGDLHLAAGSPAINSGEDLSSIAKTDIEGNERPSFRQFEMGAYEFTENAGSLRVLKWAEQAQ